MFAVYLLMLCRITIALLFIFSASSKILTLTDFEVAIEDFKLLPRHWSKLVALLFLSGEIVTAAFITIGSNLLPIGFLLATALLAIFTAALVITLRRNIDMSCKCFGRTERRISRYDVVRNVLLILCSLIGLWILRYPLQNLPSGVIILLTLMSAVFVMLATNLGDIVETLRHPFPIRENEGIK